MTATPAESAAPVSSTPDAPGASGSARVEATRTARPTARDLRGLPNRELTQLLLDGYPIPHGALDDTEYFGVSLGLPGWVERLSWVKFMKTFRRDPVSGRLRGWNVRIQQTPLDDPRWEPMRLASGAPKTFGHYEVCPIEAYRTPLSSLRGLMIDYGRGGNARWDPMRLMRDPLVSWRKDSAELLLGWSYVELGATRFGTPSFFTLERGGPLSHDARPARG